MRAGNLSESLLIKVLFLRYFLENAYFEIKILGWGHMNHQNLSKSLLIKVLFFKVLFGKKLPSAQTQIHF